jgi:polysaccharide export outer membrane protein
MIVRSLGSRVAPLVAATMFLVASAAAAQVAAPSDPPVTLEPGDVVHVAIWREPDLSGDFTVDENGTVSLPLLGRRAVAGVPLPQLKQMLIDSFQVQLRNPSIEVTPLRRIFVVGEVNKPGPVLVDPTISLAGAVALAGGPTHEGDIRRLRIVRNGQVLLRQAPSESTLSSVRVRSGDEVYVDRRGWVDRNSTFLVSAVLSVTSIAITLIRR